MSRSVNLNNVNISIAEFQKLSSGTYNAGEVKLASESKLTKINNHVSSFWRSANKIAVSHEEVLAIKNAFVRALASGGVGKDEINKVRAQLGLRPDGSADKTLAERSVKPLTRQQIREILDKNAAALNSHNGGRQPVVRTSNELYAGVDHAEQARRAGMREEVAASTAEQRSLHTGSKIALFQDVLAGNIQFRTKGEKEEMLGFAVRQRDLMMKTIMEKNGGKPDTSGEVMITCTMDNGSKVNLFAGRSEAELLKLMDDVIMFFRSPGACMSDDEAEMHREFLALSPEDRSACLDDAQKDGETFTARTAAVAMLAERDVCDVATLSHVNYLSKEEVFSLAKQLVDADPDLRGDALRNTDIVINLRNHPEPKKGVPGKEQAFIPKEMTASLYNSNVFNGFCSNSDLLPSGFAMMAIEVRAELTRRYGETVMPPNENLCDIANYSEYGGGIDESKVRGERATPESIRDAFHRSAVKSAVNRVIYNLVNTALAAAGMDSKEYSSRAVGLVKSRNQELVNSLMGARSEEETKAICAAYKEAVSDACKACTEILEAKGMAMPRAREALAKKLGVTTETLDKAKVDLSCLELKVEELASDIADGKVKLSTKKDYEKAFCDLADEFVNERTTRLDAVDKLDIPSKIKESVKVVLLTVNNVKYVDIAALAAAAKKIDVSGLEKALNEGAPIDEVYAKMKEVCRAIYSAALDTLNWKDELKPGNDDIDGSEDILVRMVVGSKDGLAERLDEFYAKPDVKKKVLIPGGDKELVSWRGLVLESFSNDQDVNTKYTREKDCFEQLIYAPRRNAPLKVAFTEAFTKALADAHVDGQVAQEAASRAAEEGYHASEVPMLLKAFTFYKGATGCSDLDAINAALDPRSAARRLLDYGGRFTESDEQFKNGLALIGKFETWYAGLHDAIKGGKRDGQTLLNFAEGICSEKASRAVEKFLFEEIAINKELPLDAEDPEDIFGMANNPAMRFVGRGFSGSFANSLALIPPEKRQFLYAVFDVFMPVPATKDEKKSAKPIDQNAILAVRVLKNLDALVDLKARGKFDRANLIPLLYPDMNLAPDATNKQINDAYEERMNENVYTSIPVYLLMAVSGATIDEARDAIKDNRRLPPLPFIASFNGHLAGLDGTAEAGRDALLGDMLRATTPTWAADQRVVMPYANARFHFNFADGEQFVAKNGSSTNKNVALVNNAIVDKIESLCGKCHPKQLSSIYFTLSQNGAGNAVNKAFIQQGIISDEHMALNFSFAKNDETGAVVVTVSEPEGFPLHFRWTSTIALDGTVTTEPMEIENVPIQENMKKIGFSGKGGETIARTCVHDATLLRSNDPAAEFKRRMNENCKDLLMYSTMNTIRRVEGSATSGFTVHPVSDKPLEIFRNDFRRGFGVTIDGVEYSSPKDSTEDEKAKAFEDVCDGFVRFVTGDKNATFAAASSAVKIKVNALMSAACQDMAGIVTTGAGLALDPSRSNATFSSAPINGALQSSFSKDEDGNIKFECTFDYKGAKLFPTDANGKMVPLMDADAIVKYSFKGTIPMDKFNRFAEADWNSLSDDKLCELSRIRRNSAKGWLNKLADNVPESFRLEIADVDTSFSVESENPQKLA